MSLSDIGQQITIYTGLFIIVVGVIGNGINILIFSSVRTYRTTPCTFYFLIASIYNIAYITINLISRIVAIGSEFDLTRTSTSWCKIRYFSLFTLSLITLSCSCLGTIDQFFASSRQVYLRQLSNIKWAHRIVFIMIIVWVLHGIPILLFYDISSITMTCVIHDAGYRIYIPIYLLGLICIIPAVIMIIFGYLTYRNIHQTIVLAQQHADRQLIRMISVQIVLVLIAFIPYGINNTYSLITASISKDTNRLSIEGFISTVLTLLPYVYYTGSCYMFLLSSSRFRRATKNRILFCLRSNQVVAVEKNFIGSAKIDNETRN